MASCTNFLRPNLLAAAIALAAGLAVGPAFGNITGTEDLTYFGMLGQGNTGITVSNPDPIQPNACVPTATANGLTYLENYANFVRDEPSPFTVTPNNYAAVNALATAMGTKDTLINGNDVGGTQTYPQFNGLQNYLSAGGANPAPSVVISGQISPSETAGFLGTGPLQAGMNVANVTPTATFLASALNANDAVEVGIEWGSYSGNVFTASGGAHELTLQSINLGTGSGTIGFIDPWGNASSAGSTAASVSATVTLEGDGFLYVTYPITWTGGDGDTNPGDAFGSGGQTGRIIDAAVQAVPEPTSLALLAIGIGGFALTARHRKVLAK